MNSQRLGTGNGKSNEQHARENPSSAGTTQASSGSAVCAAGTNFTTRNTGGPSDKNSTINKLGAKQVRATATTSTVNGEKTTGAGGITDGSKSQTTRVIKKKEDKDKKDKGENAENQEPWWPVFSFDGRNAMKSKLVLNLRNCQYDLFKTIAIEELGWRVIDNRCNVLDPLPHNEIKKMSLPASNTQDEDEASTGDNSSAKNQIEVKSKERMKVEGLQYRLIKDHDLNNWDIFWADAGMTPEFLSSLSTT